MHVLGPKRDVAGYLLLVQYGVAIKTFPGDTVIFNAREVVHANSDLEGIDMDQDNYAEYSKAWGQHRLSVIYYVK
jgi:hypothetical protein